MLSLRPDQFTLITQANDLLLNGTPSVLMVAPTGAGKTVMFSWLTAFLRGTRVMILCHRDELIQQISDTLTTFGVEHGCIAPGRPNFRERPVQVASVMTLVRRLADYAPPQLVIIDEAQHAIPNSTWGKILRAWPAAYRLGVTATPERLSGEGLRDTFGTILVGPSTRELIETGALSDYKLYAPPTTVTDGVHRRMGDYEKHELAVAMDKPTITGNAVTHYTLLADGKRALVFCVSLDHAQHVAEDFRHAGYTAARIDGQLELHQRRCLVNDFSAGRIQVLTSCDVVSEGFDLPAIEVAILLRPTQSLALHLQQMGRALRPYPGKPHAIILDHAGNTLRHGLPDDDREWSLDGKETRKKAEGEKAVSVRTCGQCFGACRSGTPTCPMCGYEFPIDSRQVEEVAGTLLQVDPMIARRVAKQEQGRANDLQGLIELGRQRRYKNPTYWAQCVLKARLAKRTVNA
jgi:superfamily II DNA or RNA helicase